MIFFISERTPKTTTTLALPLAFRWRSAGTPLAFRWRSAGTPLAFRWRSSDISLALSLYFFNTFFMGVARWVGQRPVSGRWAAGMTLNRNRAMAYGLPSAPSSSPCASRWIRSCHHNKRQRPAAFIRAPPPPAGARTDHNRAGFPVMGSMILKLGWL